MRISLLLSVLLLASSASSQAVDRVLLPIIPGPDAAGAHGSVWRTEVVITNVSDSPLQVSGYRSASHCSFCLGSPPLAPKVSVIIGEMSICDTRGGYLRVEPSRAADLVVSVRSQDVSRHSETWGTSIPVVRPDELFSGTFGINDVPMEPQFRSTLRVYNVDPTGGAVAVRFYQTMTDPPRRWPNYPNDAPDRLLLELQPSFVIPQSGGGTASCPSFFEVALDQHSELANISRLRIEVSARDERKSYWAFVSTTHNTTQHVTVLTPE